MYVVIINTKKAPNKSTILKSNIIISSNFSIIMFCRRNAKILRTMVISEDVFLRGSDIMYHGQHIFPYKVSIKKSFAFDFINEPYNFFRKILNRFLHSISNNMLLSCNYDYNVTYLCCNIFNTVLLERDP